MELEPSKVRAGDYIGQELWVCDYRYNSFDVKPIRHVPPTKVKCLSKEDTDKTIYYSECFFREGSKKSSVIKLYDNTGYRSLAGVALKVFTTEQECIDAYNELKKQLREDFQEYKEAKLKMLDRIEKELN